MSLVAASITLQAVARSRRAQRATTHKRRDVSDQAGGLGQDTKSCTSSPRAIRIQTLVRRVLAVLFVDKLRRNKAERQKMEHQLADLRRRLDEEKEQRERAERRLSSDNPTLTDESTRMLVT